MRKKHQVYSINKSISFKQRNKFTNWSGKNRRFVVAENLHLYLANVRIATGHGINDDSQRPSIPGGVDVFKKNHVSELQIWLYGVPLAAKLECLHVLLLPPCPEPVCQDLDSFSTPNESCLSR